MQIGKFFGAITLALSLFFLALQYKGLELEAACVRALAVTFLTLLYITRIKNKHPLFLLFLVFFSISEVFNYATWIIDFDLNSEIDYYYYVGNGLYILSYLFLISRILVGMDIKRALVRFPFQIVLLVILGLFFVYFVSDTTKNEIVNNNDYYLELFYNAIIMLLMALALVNYMFKDDKKSMNLLIGTICIMFSEVIQLTYFYIAEINLLNVLCSIFLVFAFLFFYLQSRLENREVVDYTRQNAQISE